LWLEILTLSAWIIISKGKAKSCDHENEEIPQKFTAKVREWNIWRIFQK
jgi:hypothetical protein